MSALSGPVRFSLGFALVLLLVASSATADAPRQGCPVGGYSIISCPVVNDQVILEAVKTRLSGTVINNWTRVTVTVCDGVVTLTGNVDTQAQSDLVMIFMRGIKGVACVNNQLYVNPVLTGEAALVGAVRKALSANMPGVKGIYIDASGNIVRLTGMVQTEFGREMAGLVAAGVPGVAAVQNNIIVRSPYNNEL